MDNEKILTESEIIVNKIKNAFKFLRRKSRELSIIKTYRKVQINDTDHYKILSLFQKCNIIIPTHIDKNIDVECIIFDCKECLRKNFPDLYTIYISNIQGSRDLLTNFYSGPKKTFFKIYWLDIIESDAGKSLTGSETLLLLDLMRHLQYKSQKKLNILKTGFTYTFYDCKVPVSEDTFKRSLPKLVEKGFLKLGKYKKGRMNIYFPSSDWKNYKKQKDNEIKEIDVFSES